MKPTYNSLSSRLQDIFEMAYNGRDKFEDGQLPIWFNWNTKRVTSSRKRPAGHPTDSFKLEGNPETDRWTWDTHREPLFCAWLLKKAAA